MVTVARAEDTVIVQVPDYWSLAQIQAEQERIDALLSGKNTRVTVVIVAGAGSFPGYITGYLPATGGNAVWPGYGTAGTGATTIYSSNG